MKLKNHIPAIALALAATLSFSMAARPAFAFNQPGQQQNNRQKAGSRDQKSRPPAGEWLRKYRAAPPEQQQRLLQNDPQFQRLPAQRQQQLEERLRNFNALPPQQQDRVLDRMQKFDALPDAQKRRVEQLHQQMHDIPENRRGPVRIAFQRLQQMPPDQRERVMNSDRFRSSFSPQEQNLIRGMVEVQDQTAPPAPRNPNQPE
jgi:hypothetical protein